MTKQDIKVGAYYTNYGNSQLYLGVGKRIMWQATYSNEDSNFIEKDLIILSFDSYHGQKVQSGDDSVDGFWDDFVEISELKALGIIAELVLKKIEVS